MITTAKFLHFNAFPARWIGKPCRINHEYNNWMLNGKKFTYYENLYYFFKTTHTIFVKHLNLINENYHIHASVQLKGFKTRLVGLNWEGLSQYFSGTSELVLVSLFCSLEQRYSIVMYHVQQQSGELHSIQTSLTWNPLCIEAQISKEIKCSINSFHLVRARSFVLNLYLRQKNLIYFA